MATVDVHEAKTRLSTLLARVAKEEDIVISRGGRPVARLVPVPTGPQMKQVLGIDKGRIWIAPDFTAPLPADVQAAFEGTEAEGPR